jgi:hypothetical protein
LSHNAFFKMNSSEKQSYLLTKAYCDAMPGSLAAAERLHIAMGVESEEFDVYGQLVVLPWHMPLPRELQRQLQPERPQDFDTATDATISGRGTSMILEREAQIDALPRPGRRIARPSNQLERSLHNKTLAQHLLAVETSMPAALQSRDANLPLLVKRALPPIDGNEIASNTLKRKLSKVKLPSAPKDEPLSGAVPNLAAQPASQHQRRISGCIIKSNNMGGTKNKPALPNPAEYEEKSESPSPPRRRSIPPIEAVLAHGFKNLNFARQPQSTTPRSHAYDPWTNLSLYHKILSPTPAFLLNMSPFQYTDNGDTYYWKSSLPMLLSYHLVNPATLIEETPIHSLTFHLPPPKPTLAFTGNRKQARTPRQAHYKTEGPESGTDVRMIRIILPPSLHANNISDEEVPFTDWIIFCLSDSPTVTPTTTRVLRSASFAPKNPYLIIAMPTQAIAETVFVARSPVISADGKEGHETISTVLRFTGRGKLPLMFGVGRDVSFADKWIQGFGMGVAALEVEVKGGEVPCWL